MKSTYLDCLHESREDHGSEDDCKNCGNDRNKLGAGVFRVVINLANDNHVDDVEDCFA